MQRGNISGIINTVKLNKKCDQIDDCIFNVIRTRIEPVLIVSPAVFSKSFKFISLILSPMANGKYNVLITLDDTDWTFEVNEQTENGHLFYNIYILKPEGYTTFHEIEQPLKMVYDPEIDELKFQTVEDLSQELDLIETYLSNEIQKRNK